VANLSDIFFRTTINGTTQNLSISGVKNVWDGVDGRWGGEASTPYELGMNQKTGQAWTPKAVPPTLLLSGGDLPQVLDRSVGVVSETLPIQIWAESYDDAVYLKTFLQRFLMNGQYEAPVTLWVKPYGATNYVVFEVLDGVVQELPSFINDEAGRGFLRTNVTITRQGWGTAAFEVPAFASNPQTFGNSPLASPGNVVALADVPGDAAYLGQPLNLTITRVAPATASRMWLATIANAETPSLTDTTTQSTNSTVGIPCTINDGIGSVDVTPAMNAPVKPRLMLRVASASSNVQVQIAVAGTVSSGTPPRLYLSEWITPAASTTLMDLGTWPVDMFRRARAATPRMSIITYIRSTNGSSASIQLNWRHLLWYYEFCRIDALLNFTIGMHIDQYTDATSYHPRQVPPIATVYDSANTTPGGFADVRGTLPRYRALPNTGGLYCAWLDSSLGHSTSAQMSIIGNAMPLYASLRGGL
jgi:hypothetical protein